MAKNPIFPLYFNDLDRSTRDWTDEEFGCYMRLLIHQWAQGEIPNDDQRLTRISESYEKHKEIVKKKFKVKTETGLKNERLESIREDRNSFSKKQKDNRLRQIEEKKLNQTLTKTQPNVNQNSTNQSKNNQPNGSPRVENEILYSKDSTIGKVKDKTELVLHPMSELEINTSIEFVKIRTGTLLSTKQINNFLLAFQIHAEAELYHSRTKKIQHFRNWLINQKFETNGKHNANAELGSSAKVYGKF